MRRRADGRTGGRAVLTGMAVLCLTVCPSARLPAQDSQFGIQGLGTPGKQESVRSRSTGGAFAAFDAFSPMMDAALADIRRLSGSMTATTSWRDVPADSSVTLRGTRFPAL